MHRVPCGAYKQDMPLCVVEAFYMEFGFLTQMRTLWLRVKKDFPFDKVHFYSEQNNKLFLSSAKRSGCKVLMRCRLFFASFLRHD